MRVSKIWNKVNLGNENCYQKCYDLKKGGCMLDFIIGLGWAGLKEILFDKELSDSVLDYIDNQVKKTETKFDDASVLLLTRLIRGALKRFRDDEK